jgi:hypothetical protein
MIRVRTIVAETILVIAALCSLQFATGILPDEVYATSISVRTDATEAVIAAGRANNQAMTHIEYLITEIGTRPADTYAYLAACQWARDELRRFGLANVHLERVGEIEGYFPVDETAARYQRLHRTLFGEEADLKRIPIVNVIADLPGIEWPDEYVILGGHLDSSPQGDGALDNGTGVSAIMEAARLLVEAGVQPKRTIRIILFGGEEVGLIGSKGYVKSHPDLLPRTSAVYIMDRGAAYLSGLPATAPLENELRQAFAAAASLDPALSFVIEAVDYLPAAVDCGGAAIAAGSEEADQIRAAGGCGSARGFAAGRNRSPASDASVPRTSSGGGEVKTEATNSCGATGETVHEIPHVTAEGDTVILRVFIAGSAANGQDVTLESLGLTAEDITAMSGDGEFKKVVALGSSDHAPFLQAGVPAFFLRQDSSPEVPYPAHTSEDTLDKVVPRYLKHSAVVLALGALGTANLDNMLSRERLTAPAAGDI